MYIILVVIVLYHGQDQARYSMPLLALVCLRLVERSQGSSTLGSHENHTGARTYYLEPQSSAVCTAPFNSKEEIFTVTRFHTLLLYSALLLLALNVTILLWQQQASTPHDHSPPHLKKSGQLPHSHGSDNLTTLHQSSYDQLNRHSPQ